ncbi:MAG: ABC transporter permease subunit [Candidatus Omnitrophica bacterium]|nr:ABC transporter permease subunit [Candidatus Omnitrophota bacterium]
MPVYRQTYSHYEGSYLPRSLAWTLIARRGILHAWRKKWFRFVLIACLFPFLVMVMRFYLAANLDVLNYFGFDPGSVRDILDIDITFYYRFLIMQSFACFIMVILTGSDLIASDRRTKALTLYLSKPITRLDYLFGKASIALFFLYLVQMIPCLTLVFLYAFFNEDWGYITGNIQLIFRIILLSHIYIVPLTALILAISSMTRSRVTATVMFCVVFFVPETFVNILRALMDESWMNPDYFTLFSLGRILEQLSPIIFKQEAPFDVHWIWYALVLSVIVGLCGLILNKQIRAVDVVK